MTYCAVTVFQNEKSLKNKPVTHRANVDCLSVYESLSMPVTPSLTLYGTLGCHLCEQAEILLRDQGVNYHHKDIADSELLMNRYGVRIPVLYDAGSGFELGWPFTRETLNQWLKKL